MNRRCRLWLGGLAVISLALLAGNIFWRGSCGCGTGAS